MLIMQVAASEWEAVLSVANPLFKEYVHIDTKLQKCELVIEEMHARLRERLDQCERGERLINWYTTLLQDASVEQIKTMDINREDEYIIVRAF